LTWNALTSVSRLPVTTRSLPMSSSSSQPLGVALDQIVSVGRILSVNAISAAVNTVVVSTLTDEKNIAMFDSQAVCNASSVWVWTIAANVFAAIVYDLWSMRRQYVVHRRLQLCANLSLLLLALNVLATSLVLQAIPFVGAVTRFASLCDKEECKCGLGVGAWSATRDGLFVAAGVALVCTAASFIGVLLLRAWCLLRGGTAADPGPSRVLLLGNEVQEVLVDTDWTKAELKTVFDFENDCCPCLCGPDNSCGRRRRKYGRRLRNVMTGFQNGGNSLISLRYGRKPTTVPASTSTAMLHALAHRDAASTFPAGEFVIDRGGFGSSRASASAGDHVHFRISVCYPSPVVAGPPRDRRAGGDPGSFGCVPDGSFVIYREVNGGEGDQIIFRFEESLRYKSVLFIVLNIRADSGANSLFVEVYDKDDLFEDGGVVLTVRKDGSLASTPPSTSPSLLLRADIIALILEDSGASEG
jgi:hypothetical protein